MGRIYNVWIKKRFISSQITKPSENHSISSKDSAKACIFSATAPYSSPRHRCHIHIAVFGIGHLAQGIPFAVV